MNLTVCSHQRLGANEYKVDEKMQIDANVPPG